MMEIHVCQNQDELIIVFKMYLKFDEKTINANIIECKQMIPFILLFKKYYIYKNDDTKYKYYSLL
jgi:hypothetical protein